MYIYVYIYICMYMYLCIYIYVCICIYIHVCRYREEREFLCYVMFFYAILPLIPFYSGPSAHPAVKSASVTNFLIHLYWSAAEPMPTGSLGLGWV